MQSYTEGYVTAFPYTYGYYAELNPLRAYLPVLRQGIAMPKIKTACELGIGQGMSLNINAAASDVEWFGTDFNPSQVSFAHSIADSSGAKVHISNDSFATYSKRDDLPKFDFIGIHGIWSWINPENQDHLVEFIHKNLAVGGVLYISYNCLPGWAPMVPVRELMALYEEAKGGSLKSGINEALNYAEKLIELDAGYMKAQPGIKARLEQARKHDPTYLAHEYFNKCWEVKSFAAIAGKLRSVMMDYICQANYLETVNAINFTPAQQELLNSIEDIPLREVTRDFIVGTQFRKDYWIKGKRSLPAYELREQIMSLKFIMQVKRDTVELKTKSGRMEARLDEKIYNPIIDAFGDNKPHALSEFVQMMHDSNITLPQLLEAVTILCGKNTLAPAADVTKNTLEHCKKLNTALENRARSSGEVNFLASPVLAGGVGVGRFPQLFLLAKKQGHRTAADWAKFAWEQISASGQKIVKEGKTLETPEENLAELTNQANEFADGRLQILERLGIS